MAITWRDIFFSMDIPICLNIFVYAITGPAIANLHLQRICHLTLNYEKSKCDMLGNEKNNETKFLEDKVQYVHNQIQMVQLCTEAVIVMFMSLLVGAWTDKFGRRPGLIFTVTGMVLTSFLRTVYVALEINPWFTLATVVPSVLTGGMNAFTSINTLFLMDKTPTENRGMRLAIYRALTTVGGIPGTFLSTPVLKATSYLIVSIISNCTNVVTFIWVIFFIEESLDKVETKGIVKGLFDMSNPKRMFITTFKKRPGANRGIILLITVVSAFATLINVGDTHLRVLFLRAKFGWVMSQYNFFNGLNEFLTVTGSLLAIFLMGKVFKIRETICCLIVFILMLIGSLMTGLATLDWYMYIVALIRCADTAVGSFIPTLMSKLVGQREIGQVMSGTTGITYLCTLVSAPLYTELYNETLSINPSIYNFLSSGLLGIAIVILIYVVYLDLRYVITAPAPTESGPEEKGKRSLQQIIEIVGNAEPKSSLPMM